MRKLLAGITIILLFSTFTDKFETEWSINDADTNNIILQHKSVNNEFTNQLIEKRKAIEAYIKWEACKKYGDKYYPNIDNY